jgi:hypothetical protein
MTEIDSLYHWQNGESKNRAFFLSLTESAFKFFYLDAAVTHCKMLSEYNSRYRPQRLDPDA